MANRTNGKVRAVCSRPVWPSPAPNSSTATIGAAASATCSADCARSADRMAERYRAAVDVELVRIEAELLADRDGLRSERLVGLDQIEILDRPSGLLERRLRGRHRADTHDRRIDTRGRPRHDPGQ